MNKAQLTIKGKKYDAYVGMYVLAKVTEDNDMNGVGELLQRVIKNEYKWLPLLIFEGINYSYFRKGETCDLKLFDLYDYIEENGTHSEEVQAYAKVLFDSISRHVPKSEDEDNAKKK